jgi:hypothetical protein
MHGDRRRASMEEIGSSKSQRPSGERTSVSGCRARSARLDQSEVDACRKKRILGASHGARLATKCQRRRMHAAESGHQVHERISESGRRVCCVTCRKTGAAEPECRYGRVTAKISELAPGITAATMKAGLLRRRITCLSGI